MNIEPRHPGSEHLSRNDMRAIRQQVATTGFLHWSRLALEWGVTVECIKTAAGYPVRRR